MEEYKGEFYSNMRHGKGVLKTKTCTIDGNFENNKPHGEKIKVTKYNYEYLGGFDAGLKSGQGVEKSKYYDEKYEY